MEVQPLTFEIILDALRKQATTARGRGNQTPLSFLAVKVFAFKSKKDEELSHWITFVHSFNYPSKEFYDGVEKELEARKIPGLKISRVAFSEGGALSDERIYLRMI